jgi:UDP-glucose 4-epimerase
VRVLVTGGAGFIGSHLAASYVAEGHDVVVLDDLSTGFVDHVPEGATFVHGDVMDLGLVREALDGAEVVFHQAASRAVARSIEDPIATDRANTLGTLNVLVAARDARAHRVIVASSSSVYGGVAPVPTSEIEPLSPKSPYAVSKMAAEQYARVFQELYSLDTVVLRYFNVFGPRQRPDSRYAAVVPLFIKALLSGEQPVIYGDGLQSRDFTFVDDAVIANRRAAEASAEVVSGHVYNVARGAPVTILELLAALGRLLDVEGKPRFDPPRPGDVRRSHAETSAARRDLGFRCEIEFEDGLARTVEWFRDRKSQEGTAVAQGVDL